MATRPRDSISRLLTQVMVPLQETRLAVLTDDLIAGLPIPEHREQYADPRVPGLKLRVSPSGVKSWSLYLRSRRTRRARLITLGRWPDITVEVAESQARDIRQRDREMLPPKVMGDPLGYIFAAFELEAAKVLKPRSLAQYRQLITGPLSDLATVPIGALTRPMIREWHTRVSSRGPVQANRALSLLRRILNWAVDEGQADINPSTNIAFNRETSRSRVLTREEIRALWSTWDRDATHSAAALKMLLLTAQRKSEVLSMQHAAIEPGDPAWWTIPAAVTKNGLAHRVPLFGLAQQVIARQPPGDWVFPYRTSKQATEAHLTNLHAERTAKLAGVTGWTPHDLRRTAASHMASLGVPTSTIAHVLNHSEPGAGVTAVYVRGSFDAQKAQALQLWDWSLRQMLDLS